MKKRIPRRQVHSKKVHKAREAKTGEHRPLTGWWAPPSPAADTDLLTEGRTKRSNSGESVTWAFPPSSQEGCEDGCHYCCGPETD